MKVTQLAFSALLAFAGAALFQQPAQAQMVPFPSDGDIFMGFHSTSANEYLVDLGSYSMFANQPAGYHLSIGNFNADLTTALGANWATDPTVQWGGAGTLDATNQLFATRAEPTKGTFAIPWERHSTSSQSGSGSYIDTMAFGDYAGQTPTANNPRGVIHSTGGLSWASYQLNGANSMGASFNTWNPTIEAPVFAGGSGIPNTRLDFFQIDPDNTGKNPPSTYIGSFDIDSAGNVSYDVFAAVPEPSTYATFIAGAALLIVSLRFRRRSAAV